MNLVNKAAVFATFAHKDQKRKFSGEPYIVHPAEVAQYVDHYAAEWPNTEEMIAAGWLHDVVEDTPFTLSDIRMEFGKRIAALVKGLTNQFVADSHMNRSERKYMEAIRLSQESAEVRLVKGCDILANLRDCDGSPDGFLKKFRQEKRHIMTRMHVPCLSLTDAIWSEL